MQYYRIKFPDLDLIGVPRKMLAEIRRRGFVKFRFSDGVLLVPRTGVIAVESRVFYSDSSHIDVTAVRIIMTDHVQVLTFDSCGALTDAVIELPDYPSPQFYVVSWGNVAEA